MFVAQEKKKTNIIEYLLYMWQVENIVRAAQFDIEVIKNSIIAQQGLTDNDKELEANWYERLIKQMKSENLVREGHLSFTKDILTELALLHQTLLKNHSDPAYGPIYNEARSDIFDLKKRQIGEVNEIEACLNGLFGLWMLKIERKEISAETEKSFQRISRVMARLGKNYHEMMDPGSNFSTGN